MERLTDRFDIQRQLGRGAFGRTLLAHDRQLDMLVALKLFDPRHAADHKAHELFAREAQVLASLRHQGVPAIHGTHQLIDDGTPVSVLAMEYIEGKSIAQMIDEQRTLAADDVLHLVLALLDILEYLHTRVPPILHRDIKPSNIIVRESGSPVLVDFGSVRRVFMHEDEGGSTIVGTYGYMPYEQYMGQATPSSDLYSLAATVLHLITGRAPREFMTDSGTLDVPRSLPGGDALAGALQRMLRAVPAERFQSARDARRVLLGGAASHSGGEMATSLQPVGVSSTPHALQPRAAGTTVRHFNAPRLPAMLPREMTPGLREILRRESPSMVHMMDTSAKPRDGVRVGDYLMFGFFSIVTFGVLPAVFLAFARARRKRLERFLIHGVETTGIVRDIGSQATAFGEKIALVKYEFEADGELHRDADRILPWIAQRMHEGDTVRVLYIPSEENDSVLLVSG